MTEDWGEKERGGTFSPESQLGQKKLIVFSNDNILNMRTRDITNKIEDLNLQMTVKML